MSKDDKKETDTWLKRCRDTHWNPFTETATCIRCGRHMGGWTEALMPNCPCYADAERVDE
jgi:hypothetical protein